MKKVGLVVLGIIIGLATAASVVFIQSYRQMQAKLEEYELITEQKGNADDSLLGSESDSDIIPTSQAEKGPELPGETVEVIYPYILTYTGEDYLEDYVTADKKANSAAARGEDYDEAFNAYFEGNDDAIEYLQHRPTLPDFSSLPSNYCGIWICTFDEDSYGNPVDGVVHKISVDDGESFIQIDSTGTWIDLNKTIDAVFEAKIRSIDSTFVGRIEASIIYTASSTTWCFDQQLPNGTTVFWRVSFYF